MQHMQHFLGKEAQRWAVVTVTNVQCSVVWVEAVGVLRRSACVGSQSGQSATGGRLGLHRHRKIHSFCELGLFGLVRGSCSD